MHGLAVSHVASGSGYRKSKFREAVFWHLENTSIVRRIEESLFYNLLRVLFLKALFVRNSKNESSKRS